MKLTDFDALSFDCYGTLIDWETGLAAVLGPLGPRSGTATRREALLAAYSTHEARAEAEHPGESYPAILARSMRELGASSARKSLTTTRAGSPARCQTGQHFRTPHPHSRR